MAFYHVVTHYRGMWTSLEWLPLHISVSSYDGSWRKMHLFPDVFWWHCSDHSILSVYTMPPPTLLFDVSLLGAILTRVETGNMHNLTDLPSHGVRKTRFFSSSPVRTPMIYPSISISWIAWHSSYMLVCVYVHGDFGVRSYVSSTHQKSLFFIPSGYFFHKNINITSPFFILQPSVLIHD